MRMLPQGIVKLYYLLPKLPKLAISRLAVLISLWIARQGGHINKLEPVVNSLAVRANELQDAIHIGGLARIISSHEGRGLR
jgi:hypothetical protein